MQEAVTTQLNIIKLFSMKPNFSELSRIYGYDRRTIKKYYEGYPGKPKTRNKGSKLDPFQNIIRDKLQIAGVNVKAVYEYLISQGKDVGGYSNFNKYVKSKGLAPKTKVTAHPRFETPEGYQAQADWKEDLTLTSRNGEKFTFNIFSYKLGYSRYCRFVYSRTKTRQDVFNCLIMAMKASGGVPSEILFDNMSSIVDLKGRYSSINPKAKAFADDFGFKIRRCKPRHAYTKGKVESANKFMNWLLPYDGEFDTEDDLIKIVAGIEERVNTSVCQATNVPPILLFQKEKEYLKPMPQPQVIESYLSHDHHVKVQKDSLFMYKGNKYSVPAEYIGKSVTVKQTGDALHVYYSTELIAIHTLSSQKINYHKDHYRQILSYSIKSSEDIETIAEANLRLMDRLL